MKRVLVLLICLLSLYTIGEANVDLSPIKEYTFLKIDIDPDGYAFINSKISPHELIFDHQYSLSNMPSYIDSDIIVVDYFSTSPSVAWRIWFHYNAHRFLGITSATITIEDKEYTFTGIGGKNKIESHDTYVSETPNILIGSENYDFVIHFLSFIGAHYDSDMDNLTLPLVLHGTEDVVTEIGSGSLMDILAIGFSFFNIKGADIYSTDGTPMTIKTITSEIPKIDSDSFSQ